MRRIFHPLLTNLASFAAIGFLFCGLSRGQTGVSIALDNDGLSSLRYQGVEYLGYGDFRLNAVRLRTAAGESYSGTTQSSFSMDAGRRELTRNYAWGSVRVNYGVSGNRLNLAITTTNTSTDTIQGLFFEPFAIRFPAKPAEYDGNIPVLGHNVGNPTVLPMTHGASILVLCNDDVARPLLVGFPFALDRPASMLLYPLRINTDREGTYPDNLPYIDRPIPPGGSDQYRVSLRFGTAGTPLKNLANDIYQAFASENPMRLNWRDRRPIGTLFLATSATGWATNPRGWLLDPNINVTTPAGGAAFRSRVLAWADNSVRILKEMNAQGMITWDIEGEEFPHATTYIGDPRLYDTLAPEMAGVADEYFKKFRDAGLRVGVCIRPQTLIVSGDKKTARQVESADPAKTLIDKITFAKNRWGATLFYIDSNGDPNLPMDSSIFRRVAAAHPDVLLMPEHENAAYFSLSAPYNELRGGVASTPSLPRDIYPGAFSVINTADGPIDGRFNDLQAAVQRGDILLFRGWFDDPGNAKVKSLYPLEPDVEKPTLAFAAPGPNSVLSGSQILRVSASDNIGVAGVQFLVDEAPLGTEITTAPFEFRWDTSTAGNGSHRITASARDAAGNTASASITVSVQNATSDTTQPVVTVISPVNRSTVSGDTIVSVSATDNAEVSSVELLLDGVRLSAPLSAAPYSITLDTTRLSNASHTLTAIARDRAGNSESVSWTVTVHNSVTDRTSPTVVITAPGSNTTVTGAITIAASASDNVAVTAVRFYIGNTQIGPDDTVAPYSASFATTQVQNGVHAITVRAYDEAGNTGSASINVTVKHPPTVADTTRPDISVTGPANNSTVAGTITLTAKATDNTGIASVRFFLDGVLLGEAVKSPWSLPLDTTTVYNGMHYLMAEAHDLAGNTKGSTIGFSISNQATAPCGSTGVRTFAGCYYTSPDLSSAAFTRLDPDLNFDWGSRAPDPRLSPVFSARWQGNFAFEKANYHFGLKITGGVRLYIDGQLVLDDWSETAYKAHAVSRALTQGTHSVTVEYRSGSNTSMAKLEWSKR